MKNESLAELLVVPNLVKRFTAALRIGLLLLLWFINHWRPPWRAHVVAMTIFYAYK